MNHFVANWKMNMTRGQASAYAEKLSETIDAGIPGAELVLAPPFTALEAARDREGRWSLAGQNLSEHAAGAFTGEVSAEMLADAGCRYVIVGHSERRTLFGDDGPRLAGKVARARDFGLVPIYCVGETGAERLAGETAATLARQLETLRDDPAMEPLVIAYEPVWAIGSGLAATPVDSAAAAKRIAELLPSRGNLRILYGGSVTPGNASDLLRRGSVNGFLVGGASLDPTAFASIARAG
jgi:triosephosphate isomerase